MHSIAQQVIMDNLDEDSRLNDTDRAILELLADGRETTKSLADQLDKHPQTVRDRLRWLREWDYAEQHHESTGLYELAAEEANGE